MWTPATRHQHSRDHLRYGSDLTDSEWEILAPFMPRDLLVKIFDKDLLDEPSLLPMFRDILGVGDQKPFDCVGEPQEAVEALMAVADRPEWRNARVVADTREQFERPRPGFAEARGADRVPARYREARDRVGES